MTAVIDAGNTRIKLYRNNRLIWHADYNSWKNIINALDSDEHHVLVSVKSGIDILSYLQKHVSCTALCNSSPLFFKSCYSLNTVGIDRLCGIAGVMKEYKAQNFALIDFGTATVINVIKNNVFCGGYITPGIITAFESITSRADNLKNISLDTHICNTLPQTTPDALCAGTILLYYYGIEGIIKKNTGNYDDFSVFFTGGNYRFLQKYCSESGIYDDAIISKGALALYESAEQ